MNKKTKNSLLLLICFILCAGIYFQQTASRVREDVNLEPFSAKIVSAEILNAGSAHVEKGGTLPEEDGRLVITVEINNTTEKEYRNVWFELELNAEAEPYLGARIRKYTSEKMGIVSGAASKQKLKSDSEKEESAGMPNVYGFVHTWNMVLTTKTDLKEYEHAALEDVWEAVKMLTVTVHWDGGSQKLEIPVEL